MKTLTVHRIGGHLAARVQADFGVTAPTVLAAPLVAASEWRPIPRIDAPVQFEGNEYYLVLTQMAAYPSSAFGQTLGDLLSFEDEISKALDRLFWGF